MNNNEEWIVVDVETSGLFLPIYTVEIAAQRMKGWEPIGEHFRILLNHDVDIEPMAESLHGYSREYLRQHGQDPIFAHKLFHEYAGNLPIVAYNISYDWNRVLEPEYLRLGVSKTGVKGFCAMTLARRVILETDNHKLETLKDYFKLSETPSHRGLNDVLTLVRLFQSLFKKRLEAASIVGFDTIAQFSRKIPVVECMEVIKKANGIPIRIKRKKSTNADRIDPHEKEYVKELLGFCKGIVADGILNEKEIISLHKWLMNCPYKRSYAVYAIADTVEKIYADGVITSEEQTELMNTINKIL